VHASPPQQVVSGGQAGLLRGEPLQLDLLFGQEVAEDGDERLQGLFLGEPRVGAEILAHPLQLEPQLTTRLHGYPLPSRPSAFCSTRVPFLAKGMPRCPPEVQWPTPSQYSGRGFPSGPRVGGSAFVLIRCKSSFARCRTSASRLRAARRRAGTACSP